MAPPAWAAARLELLEYFLVHHEDLPRCAEASLEWLARHTGVRRSICLAIDGDAGVLVGVAGLGVSIDDVEEYSAPLSHTHDPLIRALTAPTATTLRTSRENGHGRFPGFGGAPVIAVPLRNDRQDDADAVGLLLMKSGTSLTRDVAWLATMLGQKLDQIRGRGSLTEELRKLRRERALFFTIINSVTDPIMLTDTEGRLIVANSRAEKLFAASEEESEGRRRAVELNNMLFSADGAANGAVERPELLVLSLIHS